MNHHTNAIADKDKVTMAIQNGGGRRVIGRKANDRVTAFARRDLGRSDAGD
jgi:hypothetical protein